MTKVFSTYFEFLQREDIALNGVSEGFAKNNPDYEKDNMNNTGCWNCFRCSGCSGCSGCSDCSDCSGCSCCSDCSRCSDCSGCSGCSDCSDCSDCSRCSGCSDCSDCSDCSRCSDCSGCSDCSRCSDCSGCSGCSDCSDCSDCSRCSGCSGCYDIHNVSLPSNNQNSKAGFKVPVINNIHLKVYAAASQPKALNMNTWHTCDTTHCRAGWVEFLAGKEGAELAAKTSTLFAAMQIYKKSSTIPVSPVRFFESNKQALEDIKRCAELEAAQK